MRRASPPLLLVVILGSLTAFAPLSIDMYLPAFPAIAADFAVPEAGVQVTLSTFFLGLAVGQMVYGPLADRFGRKLPLYVGCAIYVVASLGCVFAPGVGELAAMRFLQALGGCTGIVMSRAVVRDLFPPRDMARVLSMLMLVMGLAPILAPILGAQLLIAYDWRAIFVVLAAFGVACLLAVAFGLRESLPPERRLRIGPAEAMRVYGRILRDRHFLGYAGTGALGFAGMFAYIAGSPFVFIEVYGITPDSYAYLFGVNAIGLIGGTQLNQRLLLRFEPSRVLRWGVIVYLAAGLVLLGAAVTGAGGLAGVVAPLFLAVTALGFIQPNAMAGAMAPWGASAGSASALLGTLQFGCGAVAGSLVGLIGGGSVGMAAVIAASGLLAFTTRAVLLHRAPALY